EPPGPKRSPCGSAGPRPGAAAGRGRSRGSAAAGRRRSGRSSGRLLPVEQPDRFLFDLGDPEGLPPDAVVADRIDEVARPDEQQKLPEVDFGDEHPAIAPDDVAGVARERVEVAEVSVRDAPSRGLEP